jgi:uncharacterized protein (DUF58 family)
MTSKAALQLNQSATALTSALPALMVEARHIAATVIQGVHGRRRAGSGESFWQYRPYGFGDSTQRIDWRKSARASHVFIRENEWEAANTLWLWANPTASMDFRSHLASVTKRHRAYQLTLALAILALRAHERVGAIGAPLRPGHASSSILPLAEWLVQNTGESLPRPHKLQRQAVAVLISDFLDPPAAIEACLRNLAEQGISSHLVQVNDPAEESLPYHGRVEFRDMAGPASFLAGKTEALRSDYAQAFHDQRTAVRTAAHRLGWSFTVHHTDQPVANLLLSLYLRIGARP